jgi:hypothetical protein
MLQKKRCLRETCAVNSIINTLVLLDKMGRFLIAALPNLDYTAEKLFSFKENSKWQIGGRRKYPSGLRLI